MTIIEFENLGSYENYSLLVKELGLEDIFESVWGETLEEHELVETEYEVIRQVLNAAEDDYILRMNEPELEYEVLLIE